jgi:hypothetical protein
MISPALLARLNAGQKVMPRHILIEVEDVLARASYGKGRIPTFMTAYQILERLDPPLRSRLIQQYGPAGLGAGKYFGAASCVASAGQMLKRRNIARIAYMDTMGIETTGRGGQRTKPSFSVCGIYQRI